MLLGESNIQSIVGRCGLEFEIEAAAEALAEGKSPGLIDASAEGGMDDQLHATAFIKESLGNDCVLGGNVAENDAPFEDVLHGLGGAGLIEAGFLAQPD